MSVTAEVETRYRTNVLSVPIQSVTTRLPKDKKTAPLRTAIHLLAPAMRRWWRKRLPGLRLGLGRFQDWPIEKKPGEVAKPIEVLFAVRGDRAVMVPVKGDQRRHLHGNHRRG